VINNGNLGMVRQWQNLFYSQRYSNTDLGTHKHRIPDFKLLAEAMGCVGLRCETREDVDKVINEAMAINDRPVVIDFVVGADAQVWPMVAAGTSNDEVQTARGIRPLFDDDDAKTGVVIENSDALGGPSVTSEPPGSHVEEER
jgi:acetolactate synthase-1/2/3 large subunit